MTESDFKTLSEIVLAEMDGLSTHLTYHSKEHTVDVIKQSLRIAKAEGIAEDELLILKIAALFHDIGFLQTYANHEAKGCEMFLKTAAGMGFSGNEKDMVTGLIMATKLPQQPKTHLQKIICDADLDYIGRNDFVEIADKLRREFLYYKIVEDNDAWKKMQHDFLRIIVIILKRPKR